MGRKAPHHVVSSILPTDLLARLDTAARWAGKTRSATIREILAEKLDARLLPERPAPLPGHGDVLLDLADELERVSADMGGRFDPPSNEADRRRLLSDIHRNTLHNILIYQAMLGLDLRAVCMERRQKGIETYGQPLAYNDGRGLGDAAQESFDEGAYLLREMGKQAVPTPDPAPEVREGAGDELRGAEAGRKP